MTFVRGKSYDCMMFIDFSSRFLVHWKREVLCKLMYDIFHIYDEHGWW